MEETSHSQEFAARTTLNEMSNDFPKASHKRQLIGLGIQKNRTIHRPKTTPGEPPADPAAD
jgi:hypothetical protein